MHRQLQHPLYLERFENLAGTCTITNRLIVADGRVVKESSFFKHGRGIFVEKEPMNAHSNIRGPGYLPYRPELRATLDSIVPRIDSMETDFTMRSHESLDLIPNLRNVVSYCPHRGCRTGGGPPRIPLPRYNKKGGSKTLFQLEIAVELIPEILCQP